MILALLFSASALFAAGPTTHAFIYGGSGDAEGEPNIFQDEFVKLARKSKALDWKLGTVLFDGQHPNAQAEVKKAGMENLDNFQALSFESGISEIENKIKSGEIKKLEQVLIVIDSHGSPKGTNNTHSVSCGSSGDCSLDRLSTVIKDLEKIGAKPAVVDLSCYSGNSLKLATPKTCVVTAATANDLGYVGFAKDFISSIGSGISLEQAFLKARSQSKEGAPQISSESGTQAQKLMERLIGPAMIPHPDLKTNEFPTTGEVCVFCGSYAATRALNNQVNDLSVLSSTAMAKVTGIAELKRASEEYWNLYAESENIYSELSLEKRTVQFGKNEMNWFNFLNTDFAMAHSAFKADLSGTAKGREGLKVLLEADKLKKKMLRSHKDFKVFAAKVARYNSLNKAKAGLFYEQGLIQRKAISLFEEERKVYSQIYKGLSSDKGGACANFIF